MFPTCVGMNRHSTGSHFAIASVPHVCGDEPFSSTTTSPHTGVFPTCVGMNRPGRACRCRRPSVPHVCGDEPYAVRIPPDHERCSPRVWG